MFRGSAGIMMSPLAATGLAVLLVTVLLLLLLTVAVVVTVMGVVA